MHSCDIEEKCYNKTMKTKIIKVDEYNINQDIMQMAGDFIKAGELVAFPTETVYGLGADALKEEASKKIYAAKGRPSDNPLIVHIADFEALEKIVAHLPKEAKLLADAYWPGPLTMRFVKNDVVPDGTTGGLNTVAVRMPSHPIALEFIRAAGGYIAAPSANRSGRPSPTLAEHVAEDMDGIIPMIIDGGQVGIGIESTIVDLAEDTISILRPGFITKEMLEETLGQPVVYDKGIHGCDANEQPKAPGMKYRHYAPKADMKIVEGSTEAIVSYINEETAQLQKDGKRVGVMATAETEKLYISSNVKSMGTRQEPGSLAYDFYKILREFDEEAVDVIFAESLGAEGVEQAVMNRMIRAAGHKIVQL